MQTISDILSEYVYRLKYEDLPEDVVRLTKMYILDYYSACMAGYKVNKQFNEAILCILQDMDCKGSSSILFSNMKSNAENAAFMNAIYAHGADMDDGNKKAMGHIGAHVISAVFSLAETLGSTWKDVLVAVVAGYEIYNRVAAAAQPGLVHRGFHSTGTAGAIACGAACAKLMKLDEKQIYSAISIAAVQASGLFVIMESGQCCKPLNPANATRVGMMAAKLAQSGICGPMNPLESQKGWFHAMTDDVHENMITDGLGKRFTVCESYLKPYPACRHTHCSIESAVSIKRDLVEKYGDNYATEIDGINIEIYHNAIPAVGMIKIPKSLDDAKFSIYYATAIALLKGQFTFNELDESNVTSQVVDLVDKIQLIEDNSLENVNDGIRGARMTVIMKDGTHFNHEVLTPKGDPANPFTWLDVQDKLKSCAGGVISSEKQDFLFESVRNMDLDGKFVQLKF